MSITHIKRFSSPFPGGVTMLMVVIDRFLGGEGTTTQEKKVDERDNE